jgi:hypothetical protein
MQFIPFRIQIKRLATRSADRILRESHTATSVGIAARHSGDALDILVFTRMAADDTFAIVGDGVYVPAPSRREREVARVATKALKERHDVGAKFENTKCLPITCGRHISRHPQLN